MVPLDTYGTSGGYMRPMLRGVSLFLFFGLCVAFVPSLGAQSLNATLAGVIRDGSGGVLPGVTVTARHTGTNQTRDTITDDRGRYALPELAIGQHEITASLQGFQTARSTIQLTVGQSADVNITMAVGSVSETIEVSASAIGVDTRSSAIGTLVTREQIENQPLNGRDFSQLILLQPGAVQARSDNGDVLTGKGAKISVHGARTNQNAYLLDGTDIMDALGRTASSAQGLVSGIESVQEFTVLTNTFSAEHGRASGGVFNIATRSGTNRFHGSLFEYHRSDKLDTKNYFDTEKPPFTRNQYGGSFGGPIVSNRLFVFGAFEGLREELGQTLVEPVPSMAARRGAFLPAGQTINSAVLPYLRLIPEPTVDNPTGERALYQGQFVQPSNLDTYNARLDFMLSERDTLFTRYTHNDSDLLFMTAETFPEFPNQGQNNQKFLTVSHQRIVSNNVVNSFRYALNRTNPRETPAPQVDLSQLAFIPGEVVGDILITGYRRFGTDRSSPRAYDQNMNQVANDLSIVHGAHALKTGVNVQHFDIRSESASRSRGEFTINTFSDFLVGRTRDFVGLAPGQGDTARHHRQWLIGMYVQDDWKMRSNLTLNMGVRYEFVTEPDEADGKITNVRFPTDPAVTVGGPLFKNPTLGNVAPRAGFVWLPPAPGFLSRLFGSEGQTSIRGGAGLYYDPPLFSVYGNMTPRQEPYFKQIRINAAPFPNVFPLLAAGQGFIDTFAIQFDPETPKVLHYNVNVQREFGAKVMVTVGYVGSRGWNLWREADFNNAFPLDASGTQFAPIATPQRRNPNFANIRYKVSDAQSFYDSLQLGVIARPASGLQAQLSYTLGKSVDDQSSSLGRTEFSNGQARTVDPYNPKLNRGPSDFDVRHSLSANYVWVLPYTATSTMGRIFAEGWMVSGIFTALSGVPMTPIYTFDQDRDATTDNEQRPNLAPGLTAPGKISNTQIFSANDFVLPAIGSRGTFGRNQIWGPWLVTFDPAIAKQFHLDAARTRSMQIRVEAFNVFNRANFAIPTVGNLTVFTSPTERNSSAGTITRTQTPGRQVQLAAILSF
ncbi:MAG: TonB-dependent receptor [Acidobacteria bacterium]|nr:TonB-dependent receptor [Acidobacteriota bacterium]